MTPTPPLYHPPALDQLLPLCSPELFTGNERRRIILQPWSITWQEQHWTIATNGTALLAIEGHHADPAPALAQETAEDLLSKHNPPAEATRIIDLDDLKKQCGEPTKKIQCPVCMDDKKTATTPRFMCATCDDDGWTYSRPRPHLIEGAKFDAALIAQYITPIEDPLAWYHLKPCTDKQGWFGHILLLRTPTWRLFVMGLANINQAAATDTPPSRTPRRSPMHKATDFECPFCGHGMAIDEPIEHDEEYETECWECKKPIIITACISTHYEAQCGHGHHDLIPSERHAGWVTCKRCDLFEKAESSVICNP